ncbi:hypothetical protein GPALN_006501 [Globodera pallida]|nr:hypothetical protein GPALN_006501 [Globodera pallida]
MAVSSSSSSSSFLVLLFVVVLFLFLPYASVDSSSSHLSRTLPAPAALPSLSHNLRHKSIAKLTTASPAVGRQKPNLAVFSYGASSAVIGEQWGNETGEELLGNGQMLASVPDLSDPCFRRYANSIIVNAQPFERRSSISLINCKVQCLRSPVGVYSCRSFVYDNLNQVCDLFAHVGDQSPAKLLRFKTRDYFEPTAAIHCALDGNEPLKANVPLSPPLMGISIKSPLSSPGAASFSTMFPLPPSPVPPHLPMKPPQTIPPVMVGPTGEQTEEEEPPRHEPDTVKGKEDGPGKARNGMETVGTATGEQPKECTASQVPRFLRTMDFELFGFDESRIGNVRGAEECASACINKRASNGAAVAVKCHSFEFTAARSDCTFSAESAVPLGNGQLRQRPGTDYFEHICVDRLLANQCQPSVVPGFRRFPQMILVGFAETVVDSPSLQECFDNCLNSRQLYGFVCSSGMFYFEEPQLNCILNTEDRKSQPELFTSETSDLVDYFETGCSAGNRTIGAGNGGRQRDDGMSLRKQDFVGPRRHREPVPKMLEASTTAASLPPSTSSSFPPSVPSFSSYKGAIWTGWTRCAGKGRWTTIGIQMRQKICGPRLCGKEERQCNLAGTTPIDGGGLRKGTEGTKSAVPRGESRRRDIHPPAVGHYSQRGRMPALLSFLWRRR